MDLLPAGVLLGSIEAAGSGRVGGSMWWNAPNSHLSAFVGTLSPSSWLTLTNLHPAVFIPTSYQGGSWVNGTDGIQQVGQTIVYSSSPIQLPRHASLWSGTAASWVDLNPAGVSLSDAHAVHAGEQVGYVQGSALGSLPRSAALWRGSAGSFTNLNPPGASVSEAFGVFAGEQVGQVQFPGQTVWACLWQGDAASWHNLHQYAAHGFTNSRAVDIWADGIHTYVVGTGQSIVDGRPHALLWIRTDAPLDSDGDEALDGTNPCNDDTDGDGVPDDIDPTPTVPGVTASALEQYTRDVADDVLTIELSEFVGPNPNVGSARRNALANQASNAANAIAA